MVRKIINIYEPYRKAIFAKVCQHCVDLGQNGVCTLPAELKCGIEVHLPEIIQAVKAVKSPLLEDYVKALRQRVCMGCKSSKPDGSCRLREEADCGLDRYFELVVEAVEEVDSKKKK